MIEKRGLIEIREVKGNDREKMVNGDKRGDKK